MSHNEIIDLEVTDLKTLENTAKRMKGELILNAKTYKWYGRNVGDYPLPEGINVADLGKCEHKIKFPGINYEVGVIKSRTQAGAYELLWDFYDSQLKEKMGGSKAVAFKQHYTMEKETQAAYSIGKLCRESEIKTEKGIGIKRRLVINI
jgi:hypothetical protein